MKSNIFFEIARFVLIVFIILLSQYLGYLMTQGNMTTGEIVGTFAGLILAYLADKNFKENI
jgi:hypothetical protein